MINGLGVVGWGVGGIEAEAVMVGQPIYMLLPEVIGFRLTGVLPDGATATDLVLRITEILRASTAWSGSSSSISVPPLDAMPVANRATIANMAPEYGATVGFFPVDGQVLDYMRLSGRDEALIATVEQYYKEQGMWRDENRSIAYSSELELDLGTIVPSLAGPTRPQDRIELDNMKAQWHTDLEGGLRPDGAVAGTTATVTAEDETFELGDGNVVIAAITSCTNTSNPDVMIGAGLVARKANERGLKRKPWVKTSLAPGSKVVTDYLVKAGLLGRPRSRWLLDGRLRLHDLHREFWAASCADRCGRRGCQPRCDLSAVWESKLRGSDQSARTRELPRLAAARCGICHCGNRGHRPCDRTSRRRPRRGGRVPRGSLADAG